jgi:hypothetical protein
MHPTHGIFHTFTCAQPQARPTQQIFFLTALHRRIIWSIISTLCTEENSKPITWAPSPLTGVHNIPSPSQRGTTHPTHGLPHPTQGHTTFLLRLREEPHTQLMGFLSWSTHSVCVLEDVSRSCNHQHSLSAREAFSTRPSLSWKYSNFVLVVIINTPSQLGR